MKNFASLLISLAAVSCSSTGNVDLGEGTTDTGVAHPDTQAATDTLVADSGSPVDTAVAVDTAPPAECSGPVTEASLCLGKASGRAGERISMPMHVLLPAGCASTTQVHATLVPSAPVGQFVPHALTPPSSCWHVSNGTDGTRFMYLSSSAANPCPKQFVNGELVRIELDIAPGTPAGEYDIALTNTSLGDGYAECRGKGGIAGHVTVLP